MIDTDIKLIEALTKNSEEEQKLLRGEGLNKRLYTREDGFVINGARLSGSSDIAARLHTRYTDFPTHSHNFLEMMTVLSGRITHRFKDKAVILEVGDILFINKHAEHSVDRAEESDLGVNVIMSDRFVSGLLGELCTTVFEDILKSNLKPYGGGGYLHFRCGGKKVIEGLSEVLLAALSYEREADSVIKDTAVLLLRALSITSRETLIEAAFPQDKKKERSAAILSYIRTSYPTATLTELAKRSGLSVPYLSAEIKRTVGKSFGELLAEERINNADKLITQTDMKIGEIIRSVGYENESYFHREYKARFGTTPLARRKEKRSK